jgi:hypothetical protein
MSREIIEEDEELQELREDTKRTLSELWEVGRLDMPNGSIVYEVRGLKYQDVVLVSISEDDNPCAKAIADQLVHEHNGYIRMFKAIKK